MTAKKLGTLGKLSQFSGIKTPVVDSEVIAVAPEIENPNEPVPTTTPVKKTRSKRAINDKPVTINIKIKKSQKDWLAETASQVRDNNTDPVLPALRVYPQHLIGVAIELLQSVDVDWSEVKTVDDLHKALNL